MQKLRLNKDTITALGKVSPNALSPVAPTLLKDLHHFGLPIHSQSKLLTSTELKKLKSLVFNQIEKFDAKRQLPYHNLSHTKAVIKRTLQLAKQAKLGAEEKQHLQIAALFHDYIHGSKQQIKGNPSFEEQSAAIADKLIREIGFSIYQRVQVYALIISTTFANDKIRPYTLLEQILVIADLGGFCNSEKGWLRESLCVTLEAPTHKRPKTFFDWLNQQENFLLYAKNRMPKVAKELKWQNKLSEKLNLLRSLKKSKQSKTLNKILREIAVVLA